LVDSAGQLRTGRERHLELVDVRAAGGLLAEWGMINFAGGIAVHNIVGMAVLASVLFVGRRRVQDSVPHSIPLTKPYEAGWLDSSPPHSSEAREWTRMEEIMRRRRLFLAVVGLLLLQAMVPPGARAQEELEVTVGVDLVSRYIWRGLNVGDSPSLQPTLVFSRNGFEIGAWGAYSTSNQITDGDEIDLWAAYNLEFENGGGLRFLLTDYYFPNAGVEFSDYNDYDDEDGPGAHILELGASVSLPGSFPLTVSGYLNIHNDEGNNTYIQLDYPLSVREISLDLFAGFTPGSEENPDLYGADQFEFLNLGMTAIREVSITQNFSFPVFTSFILNPNEDISYLVVGFSL
jgi:uncharacterized protein (TIGR02001 family)